MTTTTYSLESIELDQVTALDLQAILAKETGYEAYHAHLIGENGHRTGDVLTVIYHAQAGRAGVCSNGDSVWTDCNSADDAVERYLGINDKELCN